MKVLELFSGTHSVGNVCNERNYEVVSLDLHNADINIDILNWDYKVYPPKYFDIIWASPPCATFSTLTNGNLGRRLKCINNEIYTKEIMEKREKEIGLVILNKTKEIIRYFNPKYYFIENPKTGRMKNYMNEYNFYDVDYCMYSNWGYKKSTRIWTNVKNFENKTCNKKCGNIIDNKHTHSVGHTKGYGIGNFSLNDRYRVPYKLIRDLLDCCE